jgi:hypothetical protein
VYITNYFNELAIHELAASREEFEPGWAQTRAQLFLREKPVESNSLKRLGEPGRTRTSNPLMSADHV